MLVTVSVEVVVVEIVDVVISVVDVVWVSVVLAGFWGTVMVDVIVVVCVIVAVGAVTVLLLVTVDLAKSTTCLTTMHSTLAGYIRGPVGFLVLPPTGQMGTARLRTGRLGLKASGISRRDTPPAADMYAAELASGRKLAPGLIVTVGVVVDVVVSVAVTDIVAVASTVLVSVCVRVVVNVSVS
jgi:hypothetical protein